MGIQEINRKGKESIQDYQSRKQPGNAELFRANLMQNLRCRDHEIAASAADTAQKGESASGTEALTGRGEDRTGVGVTGNGARIRVNAAAGLEAMQTAEVRHMSYEESDNIEIAVTEGYTLKGKLEDGQVYVEAKYEDGRVEAYHVDTAKLTGQTKHRIEKFALETADCVRES